jgi:glucokinase
MKRMTSQRTLLVGDVGGTHTRLALYDESGKRRLAEAVRPSREHSSFDEIALAFLAESNAPPPKIAVLGVAGPIVHGVAKITNLAWRIDEKRLAKTLAIPRAVLLNDLVAAAHGCLHLRPSQLIALTERLPSVKRSNVGVIAAGTGLGEARLIWTGDRHLALATEGGHCDFAPQTPLEIELWHFLSNRFPDHVSYERVLCGDGLGALFDFFNLRQARTPRAIDRRLAEGDRNAVISELGLARQYRPAAKAVDMFAAIYGAEAGNLALRELALGGIYVAGNMGRHILPARRDLFMANFQRKGRFLPMLSNIPVAVVDDTQIGVQGAVAVARELTR